MSAIPLWRGACHTAAKKKYGRPKKLSVTLSVKSYGIAYHRF